MLTEEYILVYISLISCSSGWTNKSQLYNLTSTLVIQSASVGADGSQNISTAESPEPVGCN